MYNFTPGVILSSYLFKIPEKIEFTTDIQRLNETLKEHNATDEPLTTSAQLDNYV